MKPHNAATLIELTVALVIFSVVLLAAFSIKLGDGSRFSMVQESMLLRSTSKHLPIPLRKSLKVIAEGDFLDFSRSPPKIRLDKVHHL